MSHAATAGQTICQRQLVPAVAPVVRVLCSQSRWLDMIWLCKHYPSWWCRQDVIEGDYSQLLASSIFCLVLPGDGWSARMDDAMLHGCIPVIIMVRLGGGVEWVRGEGGRWGVGGCGGGRNPIEIL